uniref:Protein TIC 214 n=1 Tax=Cynanchum auriculatum TaxID=157409 RepID=A0A0X8IHN1_9GENT|nr:Ycf1 [Cynanchum auriculatum]AMD38515.1 Ycf1 [Cynanchum auriculatum]
MRSILNNLVILWMKKNNSVVLVGLYFGFLTTLSLGPSFLFLFPVQAMEEGTEKKAAAIAGFYTGRLVVFGSIIFMPMHLALGRPHTMIAIVVPYLCIHFFWNNFRSRNSLPNFSIQQIFVQNKVFQLFNQHVLNVLMKNKVFQLLKKVFQLFYKVCQLFNDEIDEKEKAILMEEIKLLLHICLKRAFQVLLRFILRFILRLILQLILRIFLESIFQKKMVLNGPIFSIFVQILIIILNKYFIYLFFKIYYYLRNKSNKKY